MWRHHMTGYVNCHFKSNVKSGCACKVKNNVKGGCACKVKNNVKGSDVINQT